MEGVKLVGYAWVVALVIGCGRPAEGDRSSWSAWERVPNAYAERFQVWQRTDDRLLLVFGHGGLRDTVGAYWLTNDGLIPPPIRSVRLTKPLVRIAAGSTTHVPFASALGRTGAIIACAHLDQVRDTALLRNVAKDLVKEIAAGDGLDREALLALHPQALLAYPFGKSDGNAAQHLGIPVVEVSEYLEEHPLGRAEWLRFFGALFGEERKADSLFAGIKERYEALRLDTTMADRPTVLFGSVWNGQWWVPPGNSYMARLIEDAGGRYVFADRKGDGNIAIDMETMVTVGASADRWGMLAAIEGLPRYSDFTGADARLTNFLAVKTGGLFIGNTLDSDLFGQALLEPDKVLLDLAYIMTREPRPHHDPSSFRYFGLVGPDPPPAIP